ncbi:MAG: hypothetical protein Hyperionvirus1_188 [Hyperionvirus sp.]|uniref:Uncharacterized protein n=1 Tax=Hyperionvirus sp. TaxID=2487770 RepID=A0A3G5ABC1_9VIRU|nr:MAG: hypothetical protein Hyperionvirus1_188 [Hyperionvirus sp.]
MNDEVKEQSEARRGLFARQRSIKQSCVKKPINLDGDIFSRSFGDFIVRTRESLLISSYVLLGADIALSIIPQEQYILFVTYSTLDSQLFITGTIGKNETATESAQRELMEETRFKAAEESDLKHIYSAPKEGKLLGSEWFTCDVDKLRYIGNISCGNPEHAYPKHKTSIIVHGSKEKMHNLISNIPQSDERGNDNISGIGCIKIAIVLSLIKKIQRKKKRFDFSPFIYP